MATLIKCPDCGHTEQSEAGAHGPVSPGAPRQTQAGREVEQIIIDEIVSSTAVAFHLDGWVEPDWPPRRIEVGFAVRGAVANQIWMLLSRSIRGADDVRHNDIRQTIALIAPNRDVFVT